MTDSWSIRRARLASMLSATGFEALLEHPGLVASGTLTPECIVGCFEPSRRYFRFQHVFRPLDARGRDAKLHTALFEQCQIFFAGRELDAVTLTKELLEPIVANKSIAFGADELPWSAESIGAKGRGREVFVDGIEVAQINLITTMGGVPTSHPSCLIAIGMDRLDRALGGDSCRHAQQFSIHEIFELRGLMTAPEVDRATTAVPTCGSEMGIHDMLGWLGDLQTDVDFRYALGIISASYRRTAIRALRQRYKAAISRWLLQRYTATATLDGRYEPCWTLLALLDLKQSDRVAVSGSLEVPESARALLDQIALQAHRNVPFPHQESTLAWTREELAAVVACEWSCSPQLQHEHASEAQTELGKGACRVQRLRRACSALLQNLGRYRSCSEDILARYHRLALIESASFISRAAPGASALNNMGYLVHWHADPMDLRIAHWREKMSRNGTPDDEDIEVLCAALTELAESLVWRLGHRGERRTSSHDSWRIKRTSLRAIRIAHAARLDDDTVLSLFRLLTAELGLDHAASEIAFGESFRRFSPQALR